MRVIVANKGDTCDDVEDDDDELTHTNDNSAMNSVDCGIESFVRLKHVDVCVFVILLFCSIFII
jgi:hypothetical protein